MEGLVKDIAERTSNLTCKCYQNCKMTHRIVMQNVILGYDREKGDREFDIYIILWYISYDN